MELQETFDSQKKSLEILKLNKENALKESELNLQKTQNIMFVVFGLLVSIILFFVYSRNKIISAKNETLDELNIRLKEQALKDPMTGLYNRRLLTEIQEKITSACLRRFDKAPQQQLKIGLVLFDIDFFKQINDNYGHDVGDGVIQNISEEIVHQLRQGDLAIRWGGEEFLVVLFDTNEEGGQTFCSRILNLRNAQKMKVASEELAITSSIGYALFPFSSENPNWLTWNDSLKIVDNFLYMAKHSGRNCAVSASIKTNEVNDTLRDSLVNMDFNQPLD